MTDSRRKPKVWFIEINETFDGEGNCESGLAYSPAFLYEILEVNPVDMVKVVEAEAYEDALALITALDQKLRRAKQQCEWYGKPEQVLVIDFVYDCVDAIADFKAKWKVDG